MADQTLFSCTRVAENPCSAPQFKEPLHYCMWCPQVLSGVWKKRLNICTFLRHPATSRPLSLFPHTHTHTHWTEEIGDPAEMKCQRLCNGFSCGLTTSFPWQNIATVWRNLRTRITARITRTHMQEKCPFNCWKGLQNVFLCTNENKWTIKSLQLKFHNSPITTC